MNGVFSLRGHDVPCRSVFGTELPFPDTEIPAGEGFLIGNNRPEQDIPSISGNVLVARINGPSRQAICTTEIGQTQTYSAMEIGISKAAAILNPLC